MAKNIIHISEAEAASNFADVLARVRAGAEIVIERREPIVVVRVEPVRGRRLVHGSYRTRRKRIQSDARSLSSDCAEMCPYIP